MVLHLNAAALYDFNNVLSRVFLKVLLHQACASADRRAVNTQAGVTFENTQHAGVLTGPGSGEQQFNVLSDLLEGI